MKSKIILPVVIWLAFISLASHAQITNLNQSLEKFVGGTNGWVLAPPTNGLVFGVLPPNDHHPTKNCAVGAIVLTLLKTNAQREIYISLSSAESFDLNLFDAAGKPVKKTKAGNDFGKPLSKQKLEDRFQQYGGRILVGLDPFKTFVVPDILSLFSIKQPGTYTLHTRLRLVKPYEYDDVWLPEIVTKIQIRQDDLEQ